MDTVDRIVLLLRRHGNYLSVTDEPYTQFRAGIAGLLEVCAGNVGAFLGYSFEQDGRMCFNPAVTIEIVNGTIKQCSYLSWSSGAKVGDYDSYVDGIVKAVWERHFVPRLDEPPQ